MDATEKDVSRPKVVISVSGGIVNAVCTNSSDIEVYLADFDELEESPKADCTVPYPIDPLDAFCAAVKTYVHRYPGLKKLVSRISK